jgi:HEPN domain-containing protein
MQTNTYDLASQKTISEFQLSNFFKHYPLEYVQENIEMLFEKVIPYPTQNDSISPGHLFYEELNLLLKNCELLYANKTQDENESHLNKTIAVVNFLKEVVPSSYIFCTSAAAKRIDIIIVMDQHKYKPFDEIVTLLDFAVLGHENISCTVYTYGTIYEFLKKGHLYFSALCTPQNCIYQSTPNFTLPSLNQEMRNELIQKSTQLFNQNIQKAISFYNGALKFANESESSISAFMIQQACELTYRSLLLALRGKQIKCHDLVVLRKHLSHFAPTIIGVLDADEGKETALLTSIQEAYIKSRYDQTYQVSLSELLNSISATDKLIQCTQELFMVHCQKIRSQ